MNEVSDDPGDPLTGPERVGALCLFGIPGAGLFALAVVAWRHLNDWPGWLTVPLVLIGLIPGTALMRLGYDAIRHGD